MTSAPILESNERQGQGAASARIAQLYERHSRMVYGVCRAMLRDGHEAEDAVQQAFLSAYKALLNGASVREEGAWLATIARNECRARISAGMRSPLPIPDEDLAAIPATGDETERSAQADALRTALTELPERQRHAVVLRDLYGLRYGEVATALGLSRPATEALLFRARRALRTRLKPVVTTVFVVPISIQEGLAQAIPGFAATRSGGVAAGVAGGGLLAKLTAGPVGVKVATATVAVTTVGTVGSVDSERAGRDHAERAAIVAVDDRSGSSGSGRSGTRHGEPDEGNSGPGGAEDSSGPGSRVDSSDRGGVDGDTTEDRSGSGWPGSRSGSGGSSSSGSGSDHETSSEASGSGGGSNSGSGSSSGGSPEDKPESADD